MRVRVRVQMRWRSEQMMPPVMALRVNSGSISLGRTLACVALGRAAAMRRWRQAHAHERASHTRKRPRPNLHPYLRPHLHVRLRVRLHLLVLVLVLVVRCWMPRSLQSSSSANSARGSGLCGAARKQVSLISALSNLQHWCIGTHAPLTFREIGVCSTCNQETFPHPQRRPLRCSRRPSGK